MKPYSVNTVIFGSHLPEIVEHSLSVNNRLCTKNNIPFIIHKPRRNLKYKTPAIQAEIEKLIIQSNNIYSLCIDWDVKLLSLPDLPSNGYPYCGYWNDFNQPDGFLTYTTSPASMNFLKSIYQHIKKQPAECLNTSNIFHRYLMPHKSSLPACPKKHYIHYNTLCSSIPIKTDIDELSKEVFNNIDVSCKKRAGTQWPMHLR